MMVQVFPLVVVKQLQVKGFTLIQCILAIAIISSISLITIGYIRPIEIGQSDLFYASYIHTQCMALFDHSYQSLNVDGCEFDDVFFFPNGTVNKAQTISCNGKEMIIHLGNGNIE